MYHVNTDEDLHALKSRVCPAYYAVVAKWFNQLRSASPLPESPFELDSGCIHVIEEGDGIPESLLASWVDYSELLHADHTGLEVWKIVAVQEDFVDTWFAPKGVIAGLDSLAERHLEQD